MATADLGPLGHQPPPAQAWDSVLIRRSTSEVQEGPDALRLLALQVLLGYRPSSQLAKKTVYCSPRASMHAGVMESCRRQDQGVQSQHS